MTTTQQTPIRTTEELFAHAIEIEREAAARYAELGERMRDLGNDVVAELFLRLAGLEKTHMDTLQQRATGLPLPPIRARSTPGSRTTVPRPWRTTWCWACSRRTAR